MIAIAHYRHVNREETFQGMCQKFTTNYGIQCTPKTNCIGLRKALGMAW